MRACEQGYIEAARLLVEKGADVNAQDESARELCVWWRRSFRPGAAFPFGWRRILGVGEVRSGLGGGRRMFSVALASSCPPYGVVEDRCACSALGGLDSSREEAKLTGRYGRTALILACGKGHVEAARLLVEKGADVNAKAESAAHYVWGDAVASDPDSASCWAAADPQSRLSFGIG